MKIYQAITQYLKRNLKTFGKDCANTLEQKFAISHVVNTETKTIDPIITLSYLDMIFLINTCTTNEMGICTLEVPYLRKLGKIKATALSET
jgi:hypothetical protein